MADLTRYSFSFIEDYAGCQEKARLRKIAKVPRGNHWAAVAGGAFHRLSERLDRIDFGIPEDGSLDWATVLEEEIADRVQRNPDSPPETWKAGGRKSVKWPDKENKAYWLAQGDDLIGKYKTWKNNQPWQVWIDPWTGDPAIEINVNGTIGGVPVTGYVDRIMEHPASGKLAVVDIKTSAREPSVFTQLDVYAQLLTELDITVDYAFYYMARTGVMTTPHVPADPARLHYLFSQVATSLKQDLFIPSPSNLCSSCDVRDYCWLMNGQHADQVTPFSAGVVI